MATDIATRDLRKPITVAEYLFRRLHEVGVRSVHGVPGATYFRGLGECLIPLTIMDYTR